MPTHTHSLFHLWRYIIGINRQSPLTMATTEKDKEKHKWTKVQGSHCINLFCTNVTNPKATGAVDIKSVASRTCPFLCQFEKEQSCHLSVAFEELVVGSALATATITSAKELLQGEHWITLCHRYDVGKVLSIGVRASSLKQLSEHTFSLNIPSSNLVWHPRSLVAVLHMSESECVLAWASTGWFYIFAGTFSTIRSSVAKDGILL